METLKSLKFAALPKVQGENPVLALRAKLIGRLEDQKALFENPLYVATEQRWEKNAEGKRELMDRKFKVRKWWREDLTSQVLLTVRYGQKTIEFEKGKAAIAVGAKDKLVAVLDLLVNAVRAGELDEALAGMSKARGIARKKAA